MKKEQGRKLSLNKETLLRLQEEQLKSAMGAEAMMSDGGTGVCHWTTCGASVNGNCSTHGTADLAVAEFNTCCKKSC